MKKLALVPTLLLLALLTTGATMTYYYFDASQITSGTISVSRLPAGATTSAPQNTSSITWTSSAVELWASVSTTWLNSFLASPPAIGGTAPAAGSFTTLSASGHQENSANITSVSLKMGSTQTSNITGVVVGGTPVNVLSAKLRAGTVIRVTKTVTDWGNANWGVTAAQADGGSETISAPSGGTVDIFYTLVEDCTSIYMSCAPNSGAGTDVTLAMTTGAAVITHARISGTMTFADNTAALAGGLVAGDIYKTSSGVLMITY